MADTLYIIDGHSQIYRAYYAPFRDLTSPTGEPTRATYVFCSMMLKFFKERRPTHVVMAADSAAEKLHRKAIYSDYKVTRKPTPEDMPVQIRRIMQLVAAMDIPILQIEGYEADDIIATAVQRLAGPEMNVVLVSRDKDLDQLLGEHVVMFDPMENKTIDAAWVQANKGYTPQQAVEIQTLMGDATDNVPGVEGVGLKTAAKLISQYGNVDSVLAHADELTPKLRERLLAAREQLPIARQLVTLDRNVPLPMELACTKWAGLQADKVRPLFAELGFNRLLDQLDDLGVKNEGPTGGLFADVVDHATLAQQAGQTTASHFDYTCIDTPEGLDALAKDLADVTRLAVDTETTCTDPMRCKLVGISLCWTPGKAVYLPVAGPLGATTLTLDDVRRALGPVLANPCVMKVGQNFKYDLIALRQAGFTVEGLVFDTMVAAHVLDSTRMTYKLDALAFEFLNHRCIPIEDLIGRGRNQTTMDRIPCSAVATYSCEDADTTFRLAEFFEKRLRTEGLYDLFANLEMPLLPVLTDMEMRGIAVDRSALGRMHTSLSKSADVLRDKIMASAGVVFNPDSPRQLAEVLFGKLGLPVQRRTKSGPSTDSDVLETLAAEHELPAMVLDYRKLQKLIGTYCESLTSYIHPATGRIHTSFHQAGTATGRLSSSDPNLQNIPVRTEEGRQIRSAFVADEGCLLLSADYSQVELRVLAHLCEDPTMMAAFHDDQDIHRIVAAEVFSVPAADVTPDMRSRAKTVNFGIIYGQTAFGLAATLRISRTEAANFINAYRQRFPRIQDFLQACIDFARSRGHVETLFGRRRRITDIDSRNPGKRNLAERLAINSVVQGSAADLIKQAMVNIDRRIRQENRPAKMLLQIHDELLFEAPQEQIESLREMVVHEMSTAIKLRVPLKVDAGAARNWMDAK